MSLPPVGRLRKHDACRQTLASGALLGGSLVAVDTTIVNAAPPSLGRDLHLTPAGRAGDFNR